MGGPISINEPGEITIGVVALQGGFAEHIEMFKLAGIKAVEIRLPEELHNVHGIVLPGGESTTISLLARRTGLEWIATGKPIWGTCAGMILLADRLTGKMKEGQETFGGLHVTVHRNYFGSQLGSFSADLKINGSIYEFNDIRRRSLETKLIDELTYKAVFIRAPVIVDISEDVEVLATVRTNRISAEACECVGNENSIVAARQGNILVTSFHPELTKNSRWHRYFNSICIELCCRAPGNKTIKSDSPI